MKSEELRIGNHVYDDSGHVDKVVWIEREGIQLEIGYQDTPKPIPLTTWWLRKFKFKVTNGNWILKANKTYQAQNEVFVWRFDSGWHFSLNGGFAMCSIKYVHQLQNLYYALTGEELTTK